MTHTFIAAAHFRIRSLMVALEECSADDCVGSARTALTDQIDNLTFHALRTEPENAYDAMLQIDLAVPLLEGAHGDLKGSAQVAAGAGLVALASALGALGFTTGRPIPSEGTLSDLMAFSARASIQYLQPAPMLA